LGAHSRDVVTSFSGGTPYECLIDMRVHSFIDDAPLVLGDDAVGCVAGRPRRVVGASQPLRSNGKVNTLRSE
jgi:hypothetical protein